MTFNKKITQIRFQCYVDFQPAKDGQTTWIRNGVSVPCIKSNRVFACQNILIITSARFEDAGKYLCLLSSDNSTFYTVAVIVPAFMSIQEDEKIVLSNGEDKLLDCGVSNRTYPPASSVDWMHNDKYIDSGSTLQLKNMSQNNTGVYKCIAFNGYGIPALKKFYVSVHGVEETTTVWPTTESLVTVPTYARQTHKGTGNGCMEAFETVSDSASQHNDPFCLPFLVFIQIADLFKY